jgi:hypothetical protein
MHLLLIEHEREAATFGDRAIDRRANRGFSRAAAGGRGNIRRA